MVQRMSLAVRQPHRVNGCLGLLGPRFALIVLATLVALCCGYSRSDAEPYAPSSRYHPQSRFSHGLKPLRLFPGYRVPAESILLKDQTTGRILYEFDSGRRLSPASLTKIMTALVILEHGDLDDLATVSREAAAAHKIRLRLRPGQVFRLTDLVKAMLMTSANDACLAAAMHVGGTEEQFVHLMNEKALALGLVDTHFSNACGFDAPDHYTTAHDLAALSEIALQHPVFRAFVKEEREVISAVNTNRSYLLRTTNRLLGRLPGIEGVKTGFTSKAGRCLIAKVSHEGKELLLVLLHSPRRWNTATHLINYGLRTPHLTSTPLR
jgi:serine-type D-Ala-D-Ala carboxypeptidase (penicillin-binding protein 5/6)